MATTRSDIPLEGIKKHGYGGWRKGCGCFTCRRGKADSQAKFRARKNGFTPEREPVTMPDGCGEIEKLVRTEIIAIGLLTDEASTIAALAIKSAKLLDKIEVEGKFHLQGGTVKTLRELLRELHGIMSSQRRDGEEEDDELAGLRTFGPQP
jgi:hypothetical protein